MSYMQIVAPYGSLMTLHTFKLPCGKSLTDTTLNKLLLSLTIILLTTIPFYLLNDSPSSLWLSKDDSTSTKCNIFSGKWVRSPTGPYYTNTTCSVIYAQQNCMKFGRPDSEFLKWRWKPNQCDLPLFDAVQFLEVVRGKSMAFVGDSVGRNQMQSLACLLATVIDPVVISHTGDIRFIRWLYAEHNFTIAFYWSPYLVKSHEANPNSSSLNSLMNLYLDEPDEAWEADIEHLDIVIISAGQWFLRPLMFYENKKLVGCYNCNKTNIINFTNYYGYRKAFRTAFRALQIFKNYKGFMILRTFSPAHYENGLWNEGGNCSRTKPFGEDEVKLDGFSLELYKIQVEELWAAKREGRKSGLEFEVLDTTKIMLLRPDGHPNYYGYLANENVKIADCVHWCLPGPIDTWNEFLLQMLKMELERSRKGNLTIQIG